jgi:hypothetical protein
MAQKLDQMEHLRQEFISNISHDIQLGKILPQATLLMKRTTSGGEGKSASANLYCVYASSVLF